MLRVFKIKYAVLGLMSLLASSICYAECPTNVADYQSFKQFLSKLIETVNLQKPEQLVPLYRFPLKISGPTERDRSLLISKDSFLKYYVPIFVVPESGFPSQFAEDIKRYPSINIDQYFLASNVFKNGCLYKGQNNVTYFDSFELSWDKTSGWGVTTVNLPSEYNDLKQFLKSKKLLTYSKKHNQ